MVGDGSYILAAAASGDVGRIVGVVVARWWLSLMVQGLLLLFFSMVDSEGIDVGSQGNRTISTKLVRYQLMK